MLIIQIQKMINMLIQLNIVSIKVKYYINWSIILFQIFNFVKI